VVNNYQVMLYNGLGLYESVPLLLYACYLTWAAFINYFASRIMDKAGRTRLLIAGLCGCSVATICEMAMVAKVPGTSNISSSVAPLVSGKYFQTKGTPARVTTKKTK
jgi:MFS family permease